MNLSTTSRKPCLPQCCVETLERVRASRCQCVEGSPSMAFCASSPMAVAAGGLSSMPEWSTDMGGSIVVTRLLPNFPKQRMFTFPPSMNSDGAVYSSIRYRQGCRRWWRPGSGTHLQIAVVVAFCHYGHAGRHLYACFLGKLTLRVASFQRHHDEAECCRSCLQFVFFIGPGPQLALPRGHCGHQDKELSPCASGCRICESVLQMVGVCHVLRSDIRGRSHHLAACHENEAHTVGVGDGNPAHLFVVAHLLKALHSSPLVGCCTFVYALGGVLAVWLVFHGPTSRTSAYAPSLRAVPFR